MNIFWVWHAKQLRRIGLVAMLAVVGSAVFWAETSDHTMLSFNHQPSAIYKVETKQKQLALTFDISWGEKRTLPILEVLKQKGVKEATFFLSSPWTRDHPQIVEQIVKAGYEIGNHGHKHVNYSSLTENEIRAQIVTSHQILTQAIGRAPNLIRLPNGDFDRRVLKIANALHYRVIQWDTDSLDWKNPGVNNIVTRVITRAHPGDIVLLHASDSCQQTHLALSAIIDGLRAKGYAFKTVSALIDQTDVKNEEVRDPRPSLSPSTSPKPPMN
jgi:polysaccharide deacetylase family sporulation protein PdaB